MSKKRIQSMNSYHGSYDKLKSQIEYWGYKSNVPLKNHGWIKESVKRKGERLYYKNSYKPHEFIRICKQHCKERDESMLTKEELRKYLMNIFYNRVDKRQSKYIEYYEGADT